MDEDHLNEDDPDGADMDNEDELDEEQESEVEDNGPLRCRGIPLDDGKYTGCAYGSGDFAPFTGPCDLPCV